MLRGEKLVGEGRIRLLYVFCFLLICVATENQVCRLSSCGDIQNISNPFRLKGDPASCGDPEYELACENNRTVLNLYHGRYYVLEINYQNYTIRVVDPALDKGDCFSTPKYYLTTRNFSYQATYFWPYEWGSNTTVLMVCTRPISNHNYIPIVPCKINGTSSSSQTYSYAVVGDNQLRDLQDSCTIGKSFSAQFKFSEPRNRSMAYLQDNLLMGIELSYLSFPCSIECKVKGLSCNTNYSENTVQCFDWSKDQCSDWTECFKPVWLRYLLLYSAVILSLGFASKYAIITGTIIVVRTVTGILCLFALVIYKYRRSHLSLDDNIEEFLQNHSNLQPIRYSYLEIKKITNGFKDKLGQGGFGSVYKGKLRSGNIVAVKVLVMSKTRGQDFINEVATIGMIHHVNVVRLVGFCVEGPKSALIYDFMPNGSLDKYIFPKKQNSLLLSWEVLYKIALGVGRGIEYLHQGCDMQILHFDIKPHNILLDQNFTPKVSDFGLAKLYSADESIVTLTAARGTLGYIAPELFYKNIGGVSYKADVYSFGMLLMEMLGKRQHAKPRGEDSSQIYFPSWIYEKINQGEDMELGEVTEDEKKYVRKMVIVALWCIRMKPADRPSMSKALEMLEGEIELLKMPPKPTLYSHDMPTEDHNNNPIRVPASSCNAMITISLEGRKKRIKERIILDDLLISRACAGMKASTESFSSIMSQ